MEISMSELRELLAEAAPAERSATEPLAAEAALVIVVLQRGWVAVGRLHQAGNVCELTDASVVRRWGTAHGLGQLAAEGPQQDTVLDQVPFGLRFHALSVVVVFPCREEAWGVRQ